MPTASIVIPFPATRRLMQVLGGCMLLLTVGFCTFYLSHTHQYLAAWFRRLDPCFYRNTFWGHDFFLPVVKDHGNLICWAGLGAGCIILLMGLLRRGKRKHDAGTLVTLTITDLGYLGALSILGALLWLWAHLHLLPYMDEVFSAIHCVEVSPFQTMAYYMLPNNHIFYNLLNNVVFHWANDHVLTGRVISGIAFLSMLPLCYGWCRQIIQHRLLAFLTTLALAVHFQVWGFGAMGRGYELCLFCEWLAFVALWQYARTKNGFWLNVFVVAIFVGFTTLPTFLFFFLALLSMAVLLQVYDRKIDVRFWRYLAVALVAVFLFYLPALSFSGVHAFTTNEYVAATSTSRATYFFVVLDKIRQSMIYGYTGNNILFDNRLLVVAVLPVLLVFARLRRLQFLGLFYVVLWASVLVIALGMKQYPYQRNLLGQLHFSYALMLITVFSYLRAALRKLRLQPLTLAIFPLFLCFFFYHFGRIGRHTLGLSIYHFDINRYGELLEMDLRDLPPNAHVAFSDESFYLLYLSRNKGFNTRQCGAGEDEYYIKIDGELLPQPPTGQYQLMWQRGDYNIYQRKQ